MEANELLKKVRKIEIRTKRLSNQIFAGEYHSAFKGKGMAFSEVREYTPGDDVRAMDWNVTARLGAPYIKVFEEERELTVMLLIDVSRSGLVGASQRTKRDLLAEISAVLSFSASINNDKVGALFFSDKVEKFIPPKKGRSQLLHIIREIIELEPESNGTDISAALKYLSSAMKRKCTAFLLSDLEDSAEDGTPRWEDALKVAVNKHDLSIIKVYEPLERKLPNVGFVHVKDAETGQSTLVNTSSPALRRRYEAWYAARDKKIQSLTTKYNIPFADVSITDDYVIKLRALFKK